MKKLILSVLVFATVFNSTSFAQDSTQNQLPQLLANYYSIKDAMVAGNANLTSKASREFIKTANSIDYKIISEGNINALLKDATRISESTDIAKQREQFANLSKNMVLLAKSAKLSNDAIYEAYCPMKKANWLSKEKEIKNPYYGNAMLTCGQVVDTINQ